MIILVLMLYLGDQQSLFMLSILNHHILMDTLDGVLARKLNETSLLEVLGYCSR